MVELEGKVAVVTGAASGIGRAMVERFLVEGMHVVMADVEPVALQQAAAELDATGLRVLPVVTDVSVAEQMQALADEAERAFGPVHLLCNNAGVNVNGVCWEFTSEEWEWVVGVDLWGVIHGIRAFVPGFVARGEGHVVNTSSMAGVALFPGIAPYTAAKQGVVGLSESLAAELNQAGVDVGVSVLCPGFVRTRIGESERNRPASAGPSTPRRVNEEIAQLLDGGMPPEEVATMVVDAVREKRFWIFTHAGMKTRVEQRMNAMLDGFR